MIRLLVSVRDAQEAALALDAGADLIDLKEPGAGALGALPLETIREVVSAVRARRPGQLVSATIGDLPGGNDDATMLDRVAAVAACGVDLVKVGIVPDARAPRALARLHACGCAVVPVFLADLGLDPDLAGQAATLGFPALMADTADKHAGSLLELVEAGLLRRFVQRARASGRPVGLAGALRLDDIPRLVALGADFAGFRTAACRSGRVSSIDPARLRALVSASGCEGPVLAEQ